MTTWNFELNRVGVPEDVAQLSLHFGGTSYEPTDQQLGSIAEGGYNAWNENMDAAWFTNAVTLTKVSSYRYNDAGKAIGVGVYQPNDPKWHGTHAGPSLPWETALVCSLYSYPRGSFQVNPRRKRGRIYLPPMAASVLDTSNSGYVSDALVTEILAACANFIEDAEKESLGVALSPPVIFSRVGQELYEVTDLYMDAKIDAQRRRQNSETAGVIHLPLS
jgi:hypothetical protein